MGKNNLTVTTETEGVVPLPCGRFGSVVVTAAFSKTAVPFSDAGETASFPALVHRFGDPVNLGVAANGLMIGIDEDNLVIFVYAILVYPIRVQYPQVTTAPANALFRDTPQSSLGLEVVHTLAYGFAIGCTLRDMLFAVTPAYTDAVYNVSLLGFVSSLRALSGREGREARWITFS